ncbi:class I SAM-dependent methyltransferase [Pseudomonas monteilii]|uniref:class I SAM-dependent methyltransferase n=1 Tax=Pseudomonas monteilii TaxID=76759 RepID=UPI0036EFE81C
MIHLHGANQYSGEWEEESQSLESHGIYEVLAEALPQGRVLEVGCGTGNGTVRIANGREVLALDNNPFLIAKAQDRLKKAGCAAQIRQCDFFDLAEEDRAAIQAFMPNVVVAWFIGSHGADVSRRTPDDVHPVERAKLYREGIEDVVASSQIAVGSVDIINLVWRGVRASSTYQEVYDALKADYDQFVFGPAGFEVYDLYIHDWNRTGSTFMYSHAHNPKFAGGPTDAVVVSLFARRQSA